MKTWTAHEDACLREHYPTEAVEDVARAMGRSVWSVRKRAQALKLQTWRLWTEADRQVLREHWGQTPTREIARLLGREPGAVKQQAMKLGLDSNRYYTAEELALVRELYPTHTAAQIAERIHGTPRAALAVYRLASKLGLRKCPHRTPEEVEAIRAACAEGGTDAAIACRLGIARKAVTHTRNRLGIPRDEAAVKEAGRQAVRTQFERLGVRNGGELRRLSYRRYATENGWPEDCVPREVQILNVLAAKGVPMSARELCRAIGMPTTPFRSGKRRILLASNGPGGTYTADLVRRGLLQCLPRAGTITGQGRGRSVHLYLLGPKALAILQERAAAACQSKDTP